MNIIISNSSGKPIYEQITSQIKNMIITVSYTHLDVYKRQSIRTAPSAATTGCWIADVSTVPIFPVTLFPVVLFPVFPWLPVPGAPGLIPFPASVGEAPDEGCPAVLSAAGPLEDTVPASPLPDGPWLDAGLPDCPPDWTDATWLSSNRCV